MSITSSATFLESIQSALMTAMDRSERVYIIGEDILDPYGGAFRVTKGLSSKYPDRVITTPISEAAITGIGTGMAIRGLLPVVEIMFGDFMALCMDQLLNSASKFPLMYKEKVSVPLVVRTPMGAGRGYGPTHSQSLEKYFLGMPGLDVVAPSIFHDPGALLLSAIFDSVNPVLFIENKILYTKKLCYGDSGLSIERQGSGAFPAAIVRNHPTGQPDIWVIAYGGTSELVRETMLELKDEEITITCICPSLISQSGLSGLLKDRPGFERVVILEEGTEGFNWGSEMAAAIYDHSFRTLKKPILRLAPPADAIPASKALENEFLVNKSKLTDAIINLLQ
ncbi:MAG TPA: transketolase C-terminal domain-containing protein [Puia sp.]|nr:transketolase C-terminal domain-containing protein [Puia sp.]